MKFKLSVECECGQIATFTPKRTTYKDEDKVVEDYTSITDGVGINPFFNATQSHEDVISFTCKGCGKTHDLTT